MSSGHDLIFKKNNNILRVLSKAKKILEACAGSDVMI